MPASLKVIKQTQEIGDLDKYKPKIKQVVELRALLSNTEKIALFLTQTTEYPGELILLFACTRVGRVHLHIAVTNTQKKVKDATISFASNYKNWYFNYPKDGKNYQVKCPTTKVVIFAKDEVIRTQVLKHFLDEAKNFI